jgi:hypothetical protein
MLAFSGHRYRKPDVCRGPGTLPSAESRALGNITICRVPDTWHSAKPNFAECLKLDTRQNKLCRVPSGRLSANTVTCAAHARYYGVSFTAVIVCRVPAGGHSAKLTLPSASEWTLGKVCHVRRTRPLPRCHKRSNDHYPVANTVALCFAECYNGHTRQTRLCRVLAIWYSAKFCECRVHSCLFAKCHH